MVEEARSWIKANSTLIYFLIAQFIAIGAFVASGLAYMVKLETRVYIMETRGAEYTVDRMNKFDQRITVLEQRIDGGLARLERVVDQYLKGQMKQPP